MKEGPFYQDVCCDSPPSILEQMFMNYVFCFVKENKVNFLNSFLSKKIYISYCFPVTRVINKIFRFAPYI